MQNATEMALTQSLASRILTRQASAVERSTKFTLIMNLKAVKAIGLTLPTSILLRGDEVIE